MAKGGSVRMAMKRGKGGGVTNFAPFIFIGAGSANVSAVAYMLGLSDADPSRIQLRKGAMNVGLPNVDVTVPPTSGVLAQSTDTFANDKWIQLRLDMIVNDNGDTVLNASWSDPAAHNVDDPAWVPVPGIAQYIDDALGVNSGSVALASGRAGWGFYSKDVTRRAYFDQFELARQS